MKLSKPRIEPLTEAEWTDEQRSIRIELLRGFVADAGRDPGSVEIGGVAMVSLSRGKSEADAAVRTVASSMGFPSEEAAYNAPVLLVGTPEKVRRELRSRIEEFGMTYYIVFPTSEESRSLLASEIMPEFTSPGGGQ